MTDSSIDRKIKASQYRARLERAAQPGLKRAGLTDTATTPRHDPAKPEPVKALLAAPISDGLGESEQRTPALNGAIGQAAEIKETVPLALQTLSAAMKADPGFAISWHATIAMSFVDEWRRDCACRGGEITEFATNRMHGIANQAASHFMKQAFNVDVQRDGSRASVVMASEGDRATIAVSEDVPPLPTHSMFTGGPLAQTTMELPR